MDHHCPWISNCVGHRNHHYFILFLVYVFVGTLYSSVLLILPFQLTLSDSLAWTLNRSETFIIASFMLSISVCIAILLLMVWQLYLILTNQTSIEFQINQEMSKRLGMNYNPYNLGISKNFENAFGQTKSDWWFKWIVPSMAAPVGNGLSYQKRLTSDVHV